MKHYNNFINKQEPKYPFSKFEPTIYGVDEAELNSIQRHAGKNYKVTALSPSSSDLVSEQDKVKLNKVACVYFICDVSGSVEIAHKEQYAAISDLITHGLAEQYDVIKTQVVAHHTKVIPEIIAMTTLIEDARTGGTIVSAGYKYVFDKVKAEDKADIYIVQLSDGDNWYDDNKHTMDMIDLALVEHKNIRGMKYMEITDRPKQALGKEMQRHRFVDAVFFPLGSLVETINSI